MSDKIKVGISIGDINGIGLEIIIKTLADSKIYDYCTPIVYGHTKVASFHRRATNVAELNFQVINDPSQTQHKKPNMINCWEEDVKIEPGVVTEAGGKYAFISLERATYDLKRAILMPWLPRLLIRITSRAINLTSRAIPSICRSVMALPNR
jgi:4-hydroxy-L-threonine phosphate dehydrogenase PdxA